MVGPIINEKVRKFIVLLYKKGGHVNCSIAATTAMVLLSKIDGKYVKIYKGKPSNLYQQLTFSTSFRLSTSMKHHSNTQEVLKNLKEIVIPYIKAERKKNWKF